MNVHNVMEEVVYNEVNSLFDTAKTNKEPWLTCTCSQCRLDTICYVLNRIEPKYIKSSRGLAHTQQNKSFERGQLSADINKLALQGMKQVLLTQRPHHNKENELPDTPVFNFPTFMGRILDGTTFEPVKNISVLLLMNGEKSESIELSWENPYTISSHTPGTYSFWVKPTGIVTEGIKKVFPFEIKVNEPGFDPISYYFEIGVTSESVIRMAYSAEHAYILPDLHLFPLEDELSSMQN